MYRCLLLIGSLVGIVQASGGSSEPLRIRVIDEYNKGVFSRVYYSDGTHRHSFFVTDHEGEVQQTPSECGKISILRARPYASEAYFDSIAQPCMSKIVLRVLHKQTPSGRAISLQTISFSLPDGSAGVLAIKVVLKSTSQDLGDPQNDRHCEFTLSAFAHQQVFRVEGENWIGLKQTKTALSNVIASAKQPDQETVTFPYNCKAASKRIQMLEKMSTDRIHRSVHKNAVMLEKILQSLGYGPANR
jgi:hypothetical protein